MNVTRTNAHEQLSGIWGLLPTPFNPDLSLDEAGLRANVRFLLGHNLGIFCVACGVGESWSLSEEEAVTIVAATKEEVGERAIVVAGLGEANPVRAARLAAQFERAGADLIMIMPPAYPKPEDDALFAFYASLADATRLPFQIYPIEANPPFSFALIERLIGIENVVSLKDVSLNMSYSYNLQRQFGDRLVIVYGRRGETEARLLYYHSIGMRGYYSNVVNFAPGLALEYWQALERKDVDTVVRLAVQLEPYANLFPDVPEIGGPVRYRNIQMLKETMVACGLKAGPVRPPLVSLTDEDRGAVHRALADARLEPALR